MKNNWIRLLAGVLASVVLVGAVALAGGMKGGKRTDGLLYQASGLHPDGEMLVIGGQSVSCEEYLFWLDMSCRNVTQYIPDVDWNAAVSEDGITYAEYAKIDAIEAAKPYALVRAWAEQAGVTLTDEDLTALEQQRLQSVALYGEEGYLQQLALMGLSEEAYNGILAVPYLYRDLYQAFRTPGSSLYVDDAALAAFAGDAGYMGAYVITLTGENAETMAEDLLERWQTAEDRDSEYAAICEELQQEADGAVTLAIVEGDPLSDAIAAMELEEIASVINPYGEEDGTCYLVLRTAADPDTLAELYFDELWAAKSEELTVVTNSKLYDGLDVGAFFEKLTALRTEMEATLSTGEEDHTGHDHDSEDGHDHDGEDGHDHDGEDGHDHDHAEDADGAETAEDTAEDTAEVQG